MAVSAGQLYMRNYGLSSSFQVMGLPIGTQVLVQMEAGGGQWLVNVVGSSDELTIAGSDLRDSSVFQHVSG